MQGRRWGPVRIASEPCGSVRLPGQSDRMPAASARDDGPINGGPVAADRRASVAGSPDPPLVGTSLRATLLHDCFAVADDRAEATLPPEDAGSDLVWQPIVFIWSTRRGVQPVIMPAGDGD